METRFTYTTLRTFAQTLLVRAGMNSAIADVVAEVLLEGDLLGKRTHGLHLLGPYLKSLADGSMTRDGEPRICADTAGCVTLDADYLPGPYVIRHAIDLVLSKVESFGVGTAVIRRSPHIACLQAYLKPVTDRGYLILLTCSDPSMASVAPFCGVKAVCTPNPLAVGIPTETDPILIDISTSITTNGMVQQKYKRGETFGAVCLQTAQGTPTNDPAVLFEEPRGTLLPLGGVDAGHKGFALAILVEALTSGLCGFGRSHQPDRWTASVFLQIIDPDAFGGTTHLQHEMETFRRACREASGLGATVRLPGEQALALRAEQLKNGVQIHSDVVRALTEWAQKLDVAMPER